jgi:hypothetical protein
VDGDNLFLARASGGPGADPGANLEADAGGQVYAVGAFSGEANFGGVPLQSAGATDVFVVKYGTDGRVLWARRAGGVGMDAGVAVSVDPMGNARVTGAFSGTAEFGGVTVQSAGERDMFLACYNAEGEVMWARSLGGTAADMGCRVACDAAGNSYVAGEFGGVATFRGTALTSAGAADVVVAKYSAEGFPLWAQRVGGAGGERATGLALDAEGGVVLAGSFTGLLTAGGTVLDGSAGNAAFVVKFGRGGVVQWAAQAGGIHPTAGTSVLVSEQGEVFLTGAFAGQVSVGGQTMSSVEPVDGFMAKFTRAGQVAWLAKDGSGSALGLQDSVPGVVDGFGEGTLDWSGGQGLAADLVVGRYREPAVATWARQAGAQGAIFRLGMIRDAGARRFLTGFIENPDGGVNLEGDALALVGLAAPAGPPPPEVSLAPQNLSVAEGTTATFRVAATGANLGYQWLHQGRELPGATAASLTLTAARAVDAGGYSVVVFNPDGAVTTPAATLTVTTPVTPPPGGPVATFTSPAEGTRITNASVMIFGQATGNGASISRVEIQNNGGQIMNAGGTATWFSLLTLQPGTNVVRARAVDGTGATGPWVSRVLLQGNTGGTVPPPPPAPTSTSPLVLSIQGNGQVTPNLHGQALMVGSNYTVTAVPASGSVFSGWSGGASGAQSTLTFTMRSNLSLQANFTVVTVTPPPPPPPVLMETNALVLRTASYVGLFYESDAMRHSNMGPFTLSVAAGGSYAGSLRPGNKSVSISGRFSRLGEATNRVTFNSAPLEVTLKLETVDGVDQLVGTVRTPGWEAPLWGGRTAVGSSTNPVPMAGRYTLVFPGGATLGSGPDGHGYGTLVVDATGKATLAATLADGTSISRSGPLTANGLWPFYAPLYSDKGFASGWVTFANRPTDDFHAVVQWEAPTQTSRTRYPGGFTNQTSLVGSRYAAPASGTRILGFDHGTADFAGAYLRGPFQNAIYLASTNKVHNLSTNKLSVTFSQTSGTFSGSATEPATGKSVSFKGAVLQKRGEGAGLFLSGDRSGRMDMGR